MPTTTLNLPGAERKGRKGGFTQKYGNYRAEFSISREQGQSQVLQAAARGSEAWVRVPMEGPRESCQGKQEWDGVAG